MNAPKMNLNPNAKHKDNNKEPETPEEYQARFFADLGNALLNMANFMGRISASISELQKDFNSHAADFAELVELKKLELEKVHAIPPDEFPSMDEPDEGESLDESK